MEPRATRGTTPAGRPAHSQRPAERSPRPRATAFLEAGTPCRICGGPVSPRYSLCTSCRDVAVSLGRPLVPITSIATVTASSDLYRVLRQYKCATHVVARRQGVRLVALLGRFVRINLAGVPVDGMDATVVVPSSPAGRPPPHPLGAVAAATRLPPVAPWLRTRHDPSAPVGHRHPSPDAFEASREVAGRRLLLLDDVYTTGAHLQSAAAALTAAGAAEVSPLVIGRFARWRPAEHGRQQCPTPRRGRAAPPEPCELPGDAMSP